MFEGLARVLKFLIGFLLFSIFFGLYGETFNSYLNIVVLNLNHYVLSYIDGFTLILMIGLILSVVYKFFLKKII